MGAAGSMSHGSPLCTGSSPSSPEPSTVEPICPDPIAFLPPFVSDIRLAQPFSASSSTALGRIPTAQELQEEIQGQARMAAKVQEAENKRASKARSREGVRGQWWPCETTDAELREFQNEGMISQHWSFMRDSDVPKPDTDERVMTKAWVERGLTLPCSEFFLSVLNTYGLQPHNICPNSYLLLSNFATLCEGHLGIRPDVRLWQFFFGVKKETKDKAMLNCGSMTFMLRRGRMYPPHDSHESVRYWNAGWFYVKNASVPEVHDGLPPFSNTPPEELASWSFIPSLAQTPILEKAAWRISWLVHDGLTGAQLTLSWFSRRIQPLRYYARKMCEYTGVDDPLRVTRHDLPADSLKRRFKTLVKVGRVQPVPELIKDINTNSKCPLLDTLAEEDLRAILRVPVSGDPAEEDPEDPEEEEVPAPRKAAPRPSKRPRAKVSGPEAGGSSEASAKKPKVTRPPPLDSRKAERERLNLLTTAGKRSRPIIPGAAIPSATTARTSAQEPITKYMTKKSPAVGPATPAPPSAPLPTPQPSPPPADPTPAPVAATPPEVIPVSSDRAGGESSGGKGASSSLAVASSELETLRASHKDLEAKLANAEKYLAEKKSELIRKEGEFQLKRKTDSETIQAQQKELGGLRKYMETAESCWDLLNSDFMDPLGYNEDRRNQFPRDDLLQLAGEDCKDLISASRKICHNLNIKDSRTCDVRGLIERMDVLPELVVDLQASSARGAAAMSLAMCLAHHPEMDLEQVTSGVPPSADVSALLDLVTGYDTRIARRIHHDKFYDKAVLPADEPLEAELLQEREAEARPAESGSQYTWTSSKDQGGASTPAAGDDEENEDASSPAKNAEEEAPEADVNVEASPAKEK
ncbi:hypothetical protein QYE76_019167 [Lolium multiflorum]|uniref:Transposase (putative) gypsy type domain-containing protein n=1 Tax=Lolium multiflorum TaxID=4521 RepID=A0AAD8R2E2_LOLMU|nr:hypothetical protein QYE76_019167 [Lolium multiflorum]